MLTASLLILLTHRSHVVAPKGTLEVRWRGTNPTLWLLKREGTTEGWRVVCEPRKPFTKELEPGKYTLALLAANVSVNELFRLRDYARVEDGALYGWEARSFEIRDGSTELFRPDVCKIVVQGPKQPQAPFGRPAPKLRVRLQSGEQLCSQSYWLLKAISDDEAQWIVDVPAGHYLVELVRDKMGSETFGGGGDPFTKILFQKKAWLIGGDTSEVSIPAEALSK